MLPLTSRLVGFLESGWGISLILLANPQELEGTRFDSHLVDLVIGPYHTPRALCSVALSWFPSLCSFPLLWENSHGLISAFLEGELL